MQISFKSPGPWNDYELIDCGLFKKLERFGKYTLIRPEPQAIWSPALKEQDWKKQAHVEFIQKGSHSGEWKKIKKIPDDWQVEYQLPNQKIIRLHLSLTSFKHVGLFPEQSVNWDFIVNFFKDAPSSSKGLNLFAYTGAATLAGAWAGLQMTHVDSIRQVVGWANRNRELSGISQSIRWMVDDAFSFVQKEMRRGNRYEFIILDPPSYGHGPKGEKWKLEDQLNDLLAQVCDLLNPEFHLLILNVYSLGFSSVILKNLLINSASRLNSRLEAGELCIESRSGYTLPLGNWAWMYKKAP